MRIRTCILLTLAIFLIALIIRRPPRASHHSRATKRCIAVLARGSPHGDFALLNRRQHALSKLPWTEGWDHIVFHEGNISENECGLSVRYVDVSPTFRKFQGNMPQSSICSQACLLQYPIGYRSMCLFWFDDFLDYISDYDEILRIDDDCCLDEGVSEPNLTADVFFASGKTQGRDAREFTEGLEALFSRLDPTVNFSSCEHPYTNVMWVNVRWAQATRGLKSAVLQSNCIQINRWGDLPLWGYFLKMLGVPIIKLPVSYHHGSHDVHIHA